MKFQFLAAITITCAVAAAPVWGADESPTTGDNPPTDVPEDSTSNEADEHNLTFYEAIEVSERRDNLIGIAGSSNEGTTGREDLERRPKLRAGELVETVPGAIATQHSGGGKANQYFLRGFNLDHGTDFAISVGGMPVNMPTHGHGQGYADLNFLIPELVERARYRKGPYFAEIGDFVGRRCGLRPRAVDPRRYGVADPRLVRVPACPGGRHGDGGRR